MHRKPNFQSDVFALGATMAEMMSARRLYGNDVQDIGMLLTRKASKNLPSVLNFVPLPYRAILGRSLAHNPDDRPTAGELARGFAS